MFALRHTFQCYMDSAGWKPVDLFDEAKRVLEANDHAFCTPSQSGKIYIRTSGCGIAVLSPSDKAASFTDADPGLSRKFFKSVQVVSGANGMLPNMIFNQDPAYRGDRNIYGRAGVALTRRNTT